MSPTNCSRCILLILLFATCTRTVHGKGGRGGGSRGRSSSSRSSSSSSGGSSTWSFRYRPHSVPSSSQQSEKVKDAVAAHHRETFKSYTPPEIPNLQEINALVNQRRSQMDEVISAHQRVTNYRKSRPSSGPKGYRSDQLSLQPVRYLGGSRQGPDSKGRKPGDIVYLRLPNLQQGIKPSGTFQVIPRATYQRQPNPHQTFGRSSPQGFPNANYPRQAINPNPSANLVRTPPLGQQPNQASGTSIANYPRQQFSQQSLPPQVLGSGVWNPKSGMPAPVYMNYGGLPTGANMYTKPMKKQGFLGSLMSVGGSSKSFKNKHYTSYPSPYGLGGGTPSNVMGGFMGNKGSKAAMYTILPYMAARKSSKLFKPKFGFYNYMPMRHHYYHHHSYMHEPEFTRVHYDVYNNEYVGRCNRPIKPDRARVVCNSTHNQVDCDVTCEEGYRYPDNTTRKTNKCWHISGIWSPAKNFPGCKPVCDEPCLNGGKCVSPGVCGCPSEYRGPQCQSHFLNCDIRKFANGSKIAWVCTHTKNETSCRVRCKSPDAQFVPPLESTIFKCTPGRVWTPSTMPLCVMPPGPEEQSVTKIPEEYVTTAIA